MSKSKSRKRAKELNRKLRKRQRTQSVSKRVSDDDMAVLINKGLQLHQSGQPELAIKNYKSVLEEQPGNLDALHLMGMALFAMGESSAALTMLKQAISVAPESPEVLTNLGVVFRQLGHLDDAQKALEKALQLAPRRIGTMCNLGAVLMETRSITAAENLFKSVLSLDPKNTLARMNLANLWQKSNRNRDAEKAYRKLLQDDQTNSLLLNNLGESLRNQGKLDEAIEVMQQAVKLAPNSVEPRLNFGRCLAQSNQNEEAMGQFRFVMELQPKHAKAFHYAGKLRLDQANHDDAISLLKRATELDSNDEHAMHTLGLALIESGDHLLAESYFCKALEIAPGNQASHGALLFLMSGRSGIDQQLLFEEHKNWARIHGSVKPIGADFEGRTTRDLDGDRKLRIGYVSPDLRQHVVAKYFLPVLKNHDRDKFEINCYAEVSAADEVTEQIKNLSDRWRLTTGLSDKQVAEAILADEIDILVDLAGHTNGNRLRAFAYRPAPIQVTWMGYPNTTGLDSMDYRITTEVENPDDEPSYHSEKMLRMPNHSACFTPPEYEHPLSELPALANGFLTFGSLHRPEKISETTLDLWAATMNRVPDSKLILFNTRFTKESIERTLASLAIRGVAEQRVDIRNSTTAPHYLKTYDEIDVALDTTPWAGGTTTIEALWMGVPAIAFCGDRRSARTTAAIMKTVLDDRLVADSIESYADLAAGLSNEIDQLSNLRNELRGRLRRTILNASKFTAELEGRYRDIWRTWCQN